MKAKYNFPSNYYFSLKKYFCTDMINTIENE